MHDKWLWGFEIDALSEVRDEKGFDRTSDEENECLEGEEKTSTCGVIREQAFPTRQK